MLAVCGRGLLECGSRALASPSLHISVLRQLSDRFGQRIFSDDTHSDFKTQYKTSPVTDIEQTIREDIGEHDVFIYMKGVPEEPMCGFSNMACRILDAYDVKYGSRNVLADAGIREGIKKFTNWPTIPQVFVKGEFIGGSDILISMHNSGELPKVLGLEEEQGPTK